MWEHISHIWESGVLLVFGGCTLISRTIMRFSKYTLKLPISQQKLMDDLYVRKSEKVAEKSNDGLEEYGS